MGCCTHARPAPRQQKSGARPYREKGRYRLTTSSLPLSKSCSPSRNLHDQSLASFKRRSTARDRAKAFADGVEIGTESPQRPETNLLGLVSVAKGSAKTKSGDSGVRVMDGDSAMEERETSDGPMEAVLVHLASASKRHLASRLQCNGRGQI
jgi:hypothetical protein